MTIVTSVIETMKLSQLISKTFAKKDKANISARDIQQNSTSKNNRSSNKSVNNTCHDNKWHNIQITIVKC